MSLPKPLMFTIGLIDQITKPIAKISQQLNGLTANYQAGTMQMASGIGGIAASGYAVQRALMPAIEMDRALGEVKSLGVRDSALKMLTDNAYTYALKYGASSTDFVRSSYDIQSAIAGLNGSDLSRFTMASNVLAKATKADAATVTNYMGTMYGIFKNDAMQMGEGAWVERLTGMTATAVQAFKTDGKKMSDAFGALGAAAGLAPLQEQMAIMGTLQATMQGSESATKYRSFLAGVGKAQQALNLQFTDAQGQMLPIIDILNQIKGKYGETLTVAQGDELAKAFGSQEAVSMVKLLLNDINGLGNSINMLGNVTGMQQAEKMAAAMTDQSKRLPASWYVIRAALGNAILPSFNSFVGWIAEMGGSVIWFTSLFPNITRWLGYLFLGFAAAVAIGGLFNLMMGAGRMAMTAWGGAVLIWNAAVWLFNGGLVALRAALLAVNIAMYANPIGLIVAGVVAAIAAVASLIYFWDDLRNTMSEWGWVKKLLKYIDWVIEKLNLIGFNIETRFSEPELYDLSPTKNNFATGGMASINHIAPITMPMQNMPMRQVPPPVEYMVPVQTIREMQPIDNIAPMQNMPMRQVAQPVDYIAPVNNIREIESIKPVRSETTKGGITQQIANANTNKSTSVGAINIYPQKVDTNFANYVEMHA